MSLIRIEVDADNVLNRRFTELEKQNLPFAVQQAVNNTAFGVREAWKQKAVQVFDRPTPFTVNATQYTKATKTRLYAEVYLRDEALKGTPPAKYLMPEVEGGARRHKAFERLLQAKGAMPAGSFAVPGKGAQLDRFGNVKARQISQIVSQLGARQDALQNQTATSKQRRRRRGKVGGEYFALKTRRGHLLPGVYERLDSGFGRGLRSVLIFVGAARYKARFNIFDYAQRTWDKLMPFNFERELAKAVQTSKFRGRG